MFCLNCGVQLPEEANFCYKCASPIAIEFESQTIHARRVVPLGEVQSKEILNEIKNFEHSGKKPQVNGAKIVQLLLAVVFIVGLIVGSNFLFSNYQEEQKNTETLPPNVENSNLTNTEISLPTQTKKPKVKKTIEQPPDETIYQNTNAAVPVLPQPQTVVNDTFAVKAGSYRYYNFNLDSLSQVVGRVEASGGNDDIDIIVLDSDEFINYKNSGNYRSYYHSGYVTIGNIDLNLAAGSYYVIFSNSAALLTNKVVKAKIEVQ